MLTRHSTRVLGIKHDPKFRHRPVKTLVILAVLALASSPALARPLYTSVQDCNDRHGLMIEVRAMDAIKIHEMGDQARANAMALLANSRVGLQECIASFEAAGERVPFQVVEFDERLRNQTLNEMNASIQRR